MQPDASGKVVGHIDEANRDGRGAGKIGQCEDNVHRVGVTKRREEEEGDGTEKVGLGEWEGKREEEQGWEGGERLEMLVDEDRK